MPTRVRRRCSSSRRTLSRTRCATPSPASRPSSSPRTSATSRRPRCARPSPTMIDRACVPRGRPSEPVVRDPRLVTEAGEPWTRELTTRFRARDPAGQPDDDARLGLSQPLRGPRARPGVRPDTRRLSLARRGHGAGRDDPRRRRPGPVRAVRTGAAIAGRRARGDRVPPTAGLITAATRGSGARPGVRSSPEWGEARSATRFRYFGLMTASRGSVPGWKGSRPEAPPLVPPVSSVRSPAAGPARAATGRNAHGPAPRPGEGIAQPARGSRRPPALPRGRWPAPPGPAAPAAGQRAGGALGGAVRTGRLRQVQPAGPLDDRPAGLHLGRCGHRG